MKSKPKPFFVMHDVKTRYEKEAQKAGGVTESVAVASAEAFIASSSKDYPEWRDSDLKELAAAVRGLQSGTGDANAHLETAIFKVGRLYEFATTFGDEVIARIALSLGDIIEVMREFNRIDPDSLAVYVQSMQTVARLGITENGGPVLAELYNGLRKVAEKLRRTCEADNAAKAKAAV